MENNEFKTARIKNRTCYSFDDMIKLEDFDIGNVLIDKKLDEYILIYDNFWYDSRVSKLKLKSWKH